MRLCVLFLLGTVVSWCQPLSFGLKAGVPLTELLTAASPEFQATTERYTLGPTVELKLPYRLAFEVDLLYKRMNYGFREPTSEATDASRWELPLLVKYRCQGQFLHPFLDVGVSFNRVTGIDGESLAELRHRGTMGFTAGAGLDGHLHVIRIAPEIRLTHWVDRNFGVKDAALRSNLTQVELLIGFTL